MNIVAVSVQLFDLVCLEHIILYINTRGIEHKFQNLDDTHPLHKHNKIEVDVHTEYKFIKVSGSNGSLHPCN